MKVLLKHPSTGDSKHIAVGWSWSMFLAAGGLMGIPLFFRGVAMWGSITLILWSLRLASPILAATEAAADNANWVLNLVLVALSGYIGLKGSALSARHYIACGYDFARPDSVEARIATENWGLS